MSGKQYGTGELLNNALVNRTGTLLASAARTATVSSDDQTNLGYKGVKVFIDCTTSAATPSVTFSIQEKDPIGGDYKSILTSAAVTGAITAPVVLTVYPGCVAVTNVVLNEPLPLTWRVTATHADTDSITYSVSYCYIV